jgi:hypothetical protein
MYALVQNTTQSGTDKGFRLIELYQKCQIYLGTEYFLYGQKILSGVVNTACVQPLCSQLDSTQRIVLCTLLSSTVLHLKVNTDNKFLFPDFWESQVKGLAANLAKTTNSTSMCRSKLV